MRAPHCEVHIFDPTLDRTEVQDMEAIDAVEFHDFGLGAKDQRVWHSSHRLLSESCSCCKIPAQAARLCTWQRSKHKHRHLHSVLLVSSDRTGVTAPAQV